MQPYRVEMTVAEQGTLVIKGAPFSAGDHVEVIVRNVGEISESNAKYPLRGTNVAYRNPFEPIADDQWEATK